MILEENYEKLFNATEIKPKKGHGTKTRDVSVTKVKVGYNFYFRGNAANSIGSRVRVFANNNAVFFPSCKNGGFAASLKKNGTRVVTLVESKAPAMMNEFLGDYDLQCKFPEGIYYIQRDENVKSQ